MILPLNDAWDIHACTHIGGMTKSNFGKEQTHPHAHLLPASALVPSAAAHCLPASYEAAWLCCQLTCTGHPTPTPVLDFPLSYCPPHTTDH